ncbi:hypothetical protein [Hamadaea tsunoensis]|uniref:hypothetical protein n=1 Tax=Hamadaea tsunoensis TaxID=53368 RepID=UPI00041F3518|nr:hypothetical protein [Hamadaea tsunoensis]
MSTDNQLRELMLDLAGEVRAEPGAAARARAGLRRSQRRRRSMAAVCGVAALAVVAATVTQLGRAAPEIDAATGNSWTDRLVNGPTVGNIAAAHDPAYLSALAKGQSKVLFLGAVGDQWVAIVAVRRNGSGHPTAEPTRSTSGDPEYGMTLYEAPAGATPRQLAAAEAGNQPSIQPLTGVNFSGGTVAIVPPGCTLATAPVPGLQPWQPAPDGRFLVRDGDRKTRTEWYQATCDGIVRQESPAWTNTAPPVYTDAELAALIGAARGTVDPDVARDTLRELDGERPLAGGAPRLLWGGPAVWPGGSGGTITGRVVVAAVPRVKQSGWQGIAYIRFDSPDSGSGGSVATSATFTTSHDPGAATALTAIRADPDANRILLLAPVGARTVRAVRDGATVAQAVVTGGAATLDVDQPATAAFEALDEHGQKIATTVLHEDVPTVEVRLWN